MEDTLDSSIANKDQTNGAYLHLHHKLETLNCESIIKWDTRYNTWPKLNLIVLSSQEQQSGL